MSWFRLAGSLFVTVAVSACARSTTSMSSPTDDAGAAGADGGVRLDSDGFPRPIHVEHDIESMGCEAEPIGQEFLIQPTLGCRRAPDYDAVTNRTFVCEVADYCTTHAECSEQPFGRCQASPSAQCVYASEPCAADEECVSHPNGSCAGSPVGGVDRYCDPDGECWPVRRECSYASEACDSDADCGAGVCEKLALFARCLYQGCNADSDCGSGNRCACSNGRKACVPADCTTAGDCAEGEACRLDFNCSVAAGFHCTSAADTCRSGDDCLTGRCEYGAGHFECQRDECPID